MLWNSEILALLRVYADWRKVSNIKNFLTYLARAISLKPEKLEGAAEQSASILIVDDTPANLQVLAGMLKDRGYKVRPVPSGKLALLAARRDPPDLILLDINMPDMNGYEVCEHLRADELLGGIPVIFISALTEQLDKVKAFATGGVDYITKPFQMEELHARVETHLKLRRLRTELEHANVRLAEANCRMSRDITERRATERALAKSLAYADDIIATLREPFVVLNSDLRVKTANRSFYDSFCVSKLETEDRLVYDLGNGQWDIPGLRKLLDEVLSKNQSVHDYEVEHTFPELGRKTMLLNARPFPPDSKHPELILLAVEDVSELRKRADELAEASRHKDEFLATLAHELRNPLAPIRNSVHYLGLEGLTEREAKTARDVISRQVTTMVRLIDDLLDLSRISRNKLDVRKEQVELAAVLESAVESSRPHINQCGHELSISLPTEALHLNADPTRLAQVFLNLLNNAAKYTTHGGQIWLTVKREGSDAVVSIRDNGIGIPDNMLSTIFDMFLQVDRSLEQSKGGLGIGLTLVRRLVDMHDGSIEARSNGLDEGSEFVVRLPLVITSPRDEPADSTESATISLNRCRILVVDDNKDAADTLAMLLRVDGNDIRTAYDGPEAVAVAEVFHPEVVLLDIGLPRLNGYDVARRMRRQPWGQSATLIALTGWGKDEDRRLSQEAGFNFHVVKPVDLAALGELLNDVQTTIV